MPDTLDNNSKLNKLPNVPTKSKSSKGKQNDDLQQGKFLLELYQKALLWSDKELNDNFLDNAVSITGSTIGFFHFISEDQKAITLTAWNGEALKNCVANYSTHYPIEKAGNWVDCVRSRRPIIYNDYANSPNQKGVPDGHVSIKRFMSIPIIENGKVRIVFGVGNKTEPYDEDDVVQLQLVANELSKIYRQRRAENTLRESEKRYRSLFENMLDGFAYCKMIFDKQCNPVDFVYLEINNAFERLTGLKREAVVGKRVREAIPGIEKANPELFTIYGRVALTCSEEKFEIFFKPLNKWFSVSVYCPQKGYFAAIFEDFTERKQMEAKLQEYSKHLEELVEERTKQLRDAEWLAGIGATAGMVGHDIRNPLQSILSELYLAKTELTAITQDDIKNNLAESIVNIENDINYINKIVQDLQDYARPIKPVTQETDLEAVCEDVLMKNDIPEKVKASCRIEAQAKLIMADPDALKRILGNLVTNAVQAMPQGGQLIIRGYVEASTTVITVQDTGMGIPEEAKSKLFTPLFTTKSKGQGFGLAVVKRMTEALGGTITFESQTGTGTKFVIRLPNPQRNRN